MKIKKYCCTCKWYSQFDGVCCNGESEHRSDFRFMDDTCEQWETNTTEFFMAMIPPTVTHQEKQIHVVKGRPVFYEPPELKAARQKLMGNLAKHRPVQPYQEGVRLVVRWCFPRGKQADGTYRTTQPDTDNLQKLLKDCMTACGYWKDDALVASELAEKFWAEIPGIYVRIESL